MPVGDKLLKAAADRLRTLVRETDTIARMGGDEFAIVQVALKHPADASALAERVIEVVSEPHDIDGHQVVVGTSVGIAVGPTDGVDPDQLMRNADLAIVSGQERRAWHISLLRAGAWTRACRRGAPWNMTCARRSSPASSSCYYQPLVNLERNEISGCEALIRWHHPEKGMISPGEFIPVGGGESALSSRLANGPSGSLCHSRGLAGATLKVAVNLSPAQFRSPGLVQVVVSALAASGLQPQRLELEITETVLLR